MSLLRKNIQKRGKRITIQNRSIVPPEFDSIDLDENFTDTDTPKALICTKRGSTFFDGVGNETPITHKLTLEYITGVTSESWVVMGNGDRLDILDVDNVNEANHCLILHCVNKGQKQASKL